MSQESESESESDVGTPAQALPLGRMEGRQVFAHQVFFLALEVQLRLVQLLQQVQHWAKTNKQRQRQQPNQQRTQQAFSAKT